MPCCTPATPTFVICRNGAGIRARVGRREHLDLALQLRRRACARPAGTSIAVGRSKPARSRTSFWNELAFADVDVDRRRQPASSRPRRTPSPAAYAPRSATVRVSHASAYGASVSGEPVSTPSTWNWTRLTPTSSLASAITLTMPLTSALFAGDVTRHARQRVVRRAGVGLERDQMRHPERCRSGSSPRCRNPPRSRCGPACDCRSASNASYSPCRPR